MDHRKILETSLKKFPKIIKQTTKNVLDNQFTCIELSSFAIFHFGVYSCFPLQNFVCTWCYDANCLATVLVCCSWKPENGFDWI